MREFLVTLRYKADYSNDEEYRGVEDVVLVEAEDRWQAIDYALYTRNIPSTWYVYKVESDEGR